MNNAYIAANCKNVWTRLEPSYIRYWQDILDNALDLFEAGKMPLETFTTIQWDIMKRVRMKARSTMPKEREKAMETNQ